jgi:5-methyltetrahydropteroyltriglutamate--homocysteine methyltransferase
MHSTDRILTTHVGSLARPPELIAFLRDRSEGKEVDDAAYQACIDVSVQDVVRKQAQAGIDIVSDGEYGKSISWSRYVLERIDGFERRASSETGMPQAIVGKDRRDFADFYKEYDPTQKFTGMTGWAVTRPLTYIGQDAVGRDIARLKAAAKAAGVAGAFLPAVAPSSVAPERKDEVHKSDEDYLQALADALHEEYRAIVKSGLMLQVDDAYLASMYDIIVPPGSDGDYLRWAEIRTEVLNHALRGLPEDRIRYHVCWGSWNGPHTTDVPLKTIVHLIFRTRAGSYSLEMANPRHEHEWRVFEQVALPAGKVLLPGVISHATNVVEHPELVAERLVRLAKLVGRENVIGSTDCGFAQASFTQRVHPSIMWAKLRALSEGAAIATRELWAR